MGQPFGDSLGRAEVEVGADTDPFEREIQSGVRKGAALADDDAAEAGKRLGDTIAEGMGKRLKESGPALAKQVEAGLSRQTIRTKTTVQFDKSGNEVGRWVSTVTKEIQDAFTDADRGPTSFFGRLSTGIADAIGAGFNVSGRSPLVALLVPLVGVIVALVGGALQAVNALVAVLATTPALLGAIAIQAGVLFIAFNGVGDAIQGAFEAKNAKELDEAIKNLTPSAQQFVRELLPLRDFFRQIRAFVQENFFAGLGNLFGTNGALTPLMGALAGLGPVARALGQFFNGLASFLGSPTFTTFVEKLMPTIVRFLDRFGPGLVTFLTGLTEFAITSLPMLESVGAGLAGTFDFLGKLFSDLANDPETLAWFDSMKETVRSLATLGIRATEFIGAFLKQLDESGGRQIIDKFAEALERLTFFISSPVGQKAMEGLVNIGITSIAIFTGLIITILSVIALIEKIGEIINMFFRIVWEGWVGIWGDITGIFRKAPAEIVAALGNVDNLLYQAGRNIINGLIRGIMSLFPNLRSVASIAASIIASVWPRSPAEEGPLSGKGDPMESGKTIMERLAAGMQSQFPELRAISNQAASTINFGPGAIKIGFEGALPTEQQAAETGQAVGSGINAILARNTRLAVRTA